MFRKPMELTTKRLCIDCSTPLQGRIDKKFCDDHCRSNYNNRIRAESTDPIKAVNLVLKRNQKILEKLNPEGKAKVSRSKLLAAGFDLNFHTHTSYSKRGRLCVFCYEQGYQIIGPDKFLLVRKALK